MSGNPLIGHCLCLDHAKMYKSKRVGIKFYYIPSDKLPPEMLLLSILET